MRGCYLIHFDQPISDGRPAQHYLGWSNDIDAREAEHRAGRGARLIQVAIERGINFRRVRVWEGYSRTDERKLKNRRDARALCPICREARNAYKRAWNSANAASAYEE